MASSEKHGYFSIALDCTTNAMPDRLPSIDIAVRQTPQNAVVALADAAKDVGGFEVEVVHSFTGADGDDIANVRWLGPSPHSGLGIQFIALAERKGRVSIEVRAETWAPDFFPSFETYCEAAKFLAKPILTSYNAATRSRTRLRIPTRESMVPRLPPATARDFDRFVALANRTGLHPLDWRRFYQFVRNSRAQPLSDEDMTILLISKGFPRQSAGDIASIYAHLCEFKAMK